MLYIKRKIVHDSLYVECEKVTLFKAESRKVVTSGWKRTYRYVMPKRPKVSVR
jgi:hypothetical protein